MTRGTTSILYLFEGAFNLWRRRLKGVYAGARERGWHVEPVNADDEGVTAKAVLRFWRPDGVIADGAALGRSGFSLADFKDIPIVYCDADEEIVAGMRTPGFVPPAMVRASFGMYSTEDEVDQLIEAVAQMAGRA